MHHRALKGLRSPLLCALAVAAFVPLAAAQAHDGGRHEDGDHGRHRGVTVLRAALAGSLPTDPAVAGVAPGGAPWVIDEGSARLRRDGRLRVHVEGLVIPTPPQNGTNPLPTLSASVVCSGTVAATTPAVPFSPAGDADLRAVVELPSPCVAPGILIHPGTNTTRYIAFSGSR